MQALTLDPRKIRDIAPEAIDRHGRLRILPAAFWARTTREERALLGHRHGLYGFPTVELAQHLAAIIDGRSALEIGAGCGVLAEALGILATDNHMQAKLPYRLVYAATRQPTVRYGPNVIDCDAATAVRRYRPEVVIGSWVTHLYDPDRHDLGGNEIGIDEADVIEHCQTYVSIGNDLVHRGKAIWPRPHTIVYPPFVYSRAHNGTRDYVATWSSATA